MARTSNLAHLANPIIYNLHHLLAPSFLPNHSINRTHISLPLDLLEPDAGMLRSLPSHGVQQSCRALSSNGASWGACPFLATLSWILASPPLPRLCYWPCDSTSHNVGEDGIALRSSPFMLASMLTMVPRSSTFLLVGVLAMSPTLEIRPLHHLIPPGMLTTAML